jgi:metal-responsive CopG/Arc/MetJ family transcriptional regulator
MGRPPVLNRRELLTARLPKSVVQELDAMSRISQSTRTQQIERYLRDGLEKSKKNIKMRFMSYALMVFAIASCSLWIWMIFAV